MHDLLVTVGGLPTKCHRAMTWAFARGANHCPEIFPIGNILADCPRFPSHIPVREQLPRTWLRHSANPALIDGKSAKPSQPDTLRFQCAVFALRVR